MDWIQTVVLALIQGLSEFLPISSSAHLILPSQILGWQDQGLAFDVAVHVGSLLAVVLYFRQDVSQLFFAWLKSCPQLVTKPAAIAPDGKLAWMIILATIPAGLAGLVFKDFIEAELRSTMVIAVTTIGFGLLLGFSDRFARSDQGMTSLTWRAALIIGLSQALALIPGTSRSGITMTAALFLGLSRDTAARFSFLLSIPLISAAGLLLGKELYETGTPAEWDTIILGTVLSFISAYCCIHLFLKVLDKMGFAPFVIYRLALGMILLALHFSA